MSVWLMAMFASLISFGLWGLFAKMSVLHIDSKSALVYQAFGFLFVGLMTLAMIGFKLPAQIKGSSFGFLSGVASGLGCLCFLIAADKGKIITVVTLTALYPLITVLLSLLVLNEYINIKQCMGIVFALVAIYFMTS